jgi:hypothetical protein
MLNISDNGLGMSRYVLSDVLSILVNHYGTMILLGMNTQNLRRLVLVPLVNLELVFTQHS